MHSNWAAEHLLVIRTLMERSAIYRRALAPIVLSLGVVGLTAAGSAWFFQISTEQTFIVYWSGVGILGIVGAFVMARRQALREAECFWSAPTRRVTQALLPAFLAGAIITAIHGLTPSTLQPGRVWWLISTWMTLYGCAVHAAGFFMPRGIKLFGWGFIALGCILAGRLTFAGIPAALTSAHLLMGGSFGGMHLAYGVYLYFTEKAKLET